MAYSGFLQVEHDTMLHLQELALNTESMEDDSNTEGKGATEGGESAEGEATPESAEE